MKEEADVCVVGSGAGGGPVAAAVAEAGYRVVVLEKGPYLERDQMPKDEVLFVRRHTLTPSLADEPQVQEWGDATGRRFWARTAAFRNANIVGGATRVMSGFFLRMKPDDFRLRSVFGPVEGSTVSDWPWGLSELEPWYDRVERRVGVSGRVVPLPEGLADRRSSPDFPQPPTLEHPLAEHIDAVLGAKGLHPFPLPRAVLSEAWAGREACEYQGYCGSYGCTSGAKGSAYEAFLRPAEQTGRCVVRPRAHVTHLESDARGLVNRAHWRDARGATHTVEARVFVVACGAIESARLLLLSRGPRHAKGLANSSGQVGRNLLFSTGGSAIGQMAYDDHADLELRSWEPFVNRALQDHYVVAGPDGRPQRGGTLLFLFVHPHPIGNAVGQAMAGGGRPLWGRALKQRLLGTWSEGRRLEVETFGEWLPHAGARVTLDPEVRDRFGLPVARVSADVHPRSRFGAVRLAQLGAGHLGELGARGVHLPASNGGPSTNLVGGTCRFGDDPATSVLDRTCRAHDVDNLYVSDGSFLPSAGAVPFTFTLYANALRVGHQIVERLGGPRPG